MTRVARAVFRLSAFALCLDTSALISQTAFGTISGTMTDPSGAIVANGSVVIRNLATGVVREVLTNKSGFYSAPSLLPAQYEIVASAPGFAKEIVSDIPLTVGSEQVVNLKMRIGEFLQALQASASIQEIDLATSALNHVVGADTIRELPLNGRDWSQLMTLEPGVSEVEIHGSGGNQTGNGKQYTISGGRPTENNYLLNGVSINDYANAGPGSTLGVDLGVDAIQEFSILTGTYPAEYGRSSGGIINAVIRSGANALHGSAYDFIRNSAFDARNFFDVTSGPPEFQRHQYGGTIGGPIKKDRTFYFADYEGLRQSLASTTISTVPSASARDGQLSTGPVTVSPLITPFLAIYPLPNGPLLGKGDTGEYIFASPTISSENYAVGRIDHKASERDSLSGAYYFDTAIQTAPDEFNNKAVSSISGNQALTLEESHIWRPQLVNSFRAGFTRTTSANGIGTTIYNPALEDLALGFDPGRYVGLIQVSGLTDFSGGLNGIQNFVFAYNSYQVYDDIFLTRGRHSLKFGANFERDQENYRSPFQPNGLFQFGSLSAFLQAQPTELQAQLPGANTERGVRQAIAGGYLQDDFHWRPNFTLNLGLRYEISTVPSEVNGMLANLVNLTDHTVTVGGPLFHNPTFHNFEPRVGFAWDPLHDGKTSIRAAFGIFDVLPLAYLFTTRFNRTPPYFLTGFVNNLQDVPGAFPNGAYDLLGPQTSRTIHIQSNPSRPYKMQWNMNIERQLTSSLAAAVGYVGSRGLHLPTQDEDEDIAMPVTTPNGYYFPASAQRINPNFGRIAATTWNVDSYYDALQQP